ncbi:hypothetical protein XJ18_19090 [Bacillus pumilus]|nr:hypothetical protein XJ18_19090 [Bacillus pumilus]
MWVINANDVIHLGRTPGGDRFTLFVDELIRAQSFLNGVPPSSIITNLRTNIADGGVDTKVDSLGPESSIDWLQEPSIFQYKASGYKGGEKDLEREINKRFSKECITNGFAYRYCVCDSMPVETKQEWERILNTAASKINPDSPRVCVITAEDLASWASRFPSIILKYFRIPSSNLVVHLEAWGANIKKLTPQYTVIPEWENVTSKIQEMMDFSHEVPEVVMTIQGEAGIGKTRLVYESVSTKSEAKYLVVYTNDEHNCIQVATMMVNDPTINALIIADESSLKARQSLKSILNGHSDRVRVIAIDNSGERPIDLSYEFWLEKMSPALLHSILEANYPVVPSERLRLYAELSGGFVRLAADLCIYDSRIAADGHVGAGLPNIRDYYFSRLSKEERTVIEAITLLNKVGYKNEVSNELKQLCEFLSMDLKNVIHIARRLHDVPGFIALAGRYMYVMPELIAQVAFDEAYRHWIKEDTKSFLENMPEALLDGFLLRVAWNGREEVRRQIGGYFRRWVASLEPARLYEIKTVDKLEKLVEADPALYLPMLKRLVEQANDEELLNVSSDSPGRWGPRRKLVWLTERLASFPEYFLDSQAILMRLALAENEPNISNNATGTWKSLFRIVLSGTALSFEDRSTILRNHIFSDDTAVSNLAISALSKVFSESNTRVVGKPVVGGRIVPNEWNPETIEEYRKSLKNAICILEEMKAKPSDRLKKAALNTAAEEIRKLLGFGIFEELKNLFSDDWTLFVSSSKVINEIEEFIYYDCEIKPGKKNYYCNGVRNWLEELRPRDLFGRLQSLVGVSEWHYSMVGQEENWNAELKKLSQELLAHPSIIEEYQSWLFSLEAKSSFKLGMELGLMDKEVSLIDLLVQASIKFKETTLTNGYISSLFQSGSEKNIVLLNEIFDTLQEQHPEVAHGLYIIGGDNASAFQRSIALFDQKKISPSHLSAFASGIGNRSLFPNEAVELVKRVYPSAKNGDNVSIQTVYSTVFKQIRNNSELHNDSVFEDNEFNNWIWKIIENIRPETSRVIFEWENILEKLVYLEPIKVIKILTRYFGDEDYTLDQHVTSMLVKISKQYPTLIMDYLGEVILDKAKAYMFYIRKYNNLMQALPSNIVIQWVRKNGVEAARRIARHLPLPYLGEGLVPTVPPLTDFILENFGKDERTFNEFVAGAHSFQFYSGVEQYEAEATVAKHFLNHKNKRIREWALCEIEAVDYHVKELRILNEEIDLE